MHLVVSEPVANERLFGEQWRANKQQSRLDFYAFVESNEDMTVLRRNGDKSPAPSCELGSRVPLRL